MQRKEIDVDFRGQFRLAKTNDKKFSHWEVLNFNAWAFEYCPTLNVTLLFDNEQHRIGCVLGYAITSDGVLIRDSLTLPVSKNTDIFEDSIESFVSSLAGRYVALIITDTVSKVYIDPAGQLSVVFTPKEKMVGSSLYVISDISKPLIDLAELINIPEEDASYQFGITPHVGVKRLLPNHFLDLRDFIERRHWPRPGELSTRSSKNIELTVDKIRRKLRRNILAVIDQHPVCMSLTAGRDSRMLLASVMDRLEEIQFFTMQLPDENARLDCRVATSLAKRFHFKHEILEWQEANAEELNTWQIRVGRSCAGRTWRAVRTRLQLDPKRTLLPGLIGEMFRGSLWQDSDFSSKVISTEELVVRIEKQNQPVISKAAAHWMSNLPLTNPLDVLNFYELEQLFGCKAAPSHYGHINNPMITVLSDRHILELALELPADYRFKGLLAKDLIRQYSQKMSRIPFNEDFGTRAIFRRTTRKVRAFVGLRTRLKKAVSASKLFFR
jgi:hypothetical protein